MESACIVTDENGHELQTHGTSDFPCAIYNSTRGDYPWHWHDELELVYVYKGPILFAVGRERYTLNDGDGLFINSAVPHAVFAVNGCDYNESDIVVHPRLLYGSIDSVIWRKYLRPLIRCSALQGIHLHRDVDWQRRSAELIMRASEAWQVGAEGYEVEIREHLTRFCIEIWQRNKEQIDEPESKLRQKSERVKIIMDCLQSRYPEQITLTELAAQVHICERECQREFKSIIGLSPMQYLCQLRLSEAAKMLKESRAGVTEICFACGFQSPSYFAKIFKAKYGVTPQQYRG